MRLLPLIPVILSTLSWAADNPAPRALERCNVVFTTPSTDASGAVPIGNGSLGASVWVETTGDVVFYLNHTDAFSEASRLLKIGKVRIHCEPSPLPAGAVFRQELKLREGRLEVALGASRLALFVEADRPVMRVIGQFAVATKVTVSDHGWRPSRVVFSGDPGDPAFTLNNSELGSSWTMDGAPASITVAESADVRLTSQQAPYAIGWYHHNADSPVPVTLKHQSCDTLPGTFDPILNRTFGAWITGPEMKQNADGALVSVVAKSKLDLRIACPMVVTPDPIAWITAAQQTANAAISGSQAQDRTAATWAAFWNRSWIFTRGDAAIAVPDNHHPLRIGIDSNGESRFSGAFGRTAIYASALPAAAIAKLAACDPQNDTPITTDRFISLASPAPGTCRAEFTNANFSRGLTISAWIHPDQLQAGRIVDRMTANGSDGFLFDTWPGNALRLIVGGSSVLVKDVLNAGTWQHVAATYDPTTAAITLYRNGQPVGGTATTSQTSLSQAYQLQRYIFACQTRGEFPPKYNGGIFTVEPRFADEKLKYSADWRRWGDSYWFQNTRLIYHPMLMAGDADLMEPLWSLYRRPRQMAEARSKSWYGSEGAWIPETMTLFGTYANKDYGWNRDGMKPGDVGSPWWRWAWNQTPELIDLLLKRYEWTQDDDFARRELLPQAESLLRYFDSRFKRDDHGILVIDPAQSAETYWRGVVNDLPNVAGLHCVLPRLRALPQSLTTASQRELFDRLWKACPPIPIGDRDTKGGRLRVILPAERFEDRTNNCENTETYAIWPFAQFGVGKPDLELARTSYQVRKFDLPCGWGYDGQVAAMLGLADESARIMSLKLRNSHPNYRFPATWGPNFDWLPDNDHGGNLMLTAQVMLMQCDGNVIRLLPAWPTTWEANFKLHAPGKTTVSGRVQGGRLVSLDVVPAIRRKDVMVCAPFTAP